MIKLNVVKNKRQKKVTGVKSKNRDKSYRRDCENCKVNLTLSISGISSDLSF